MTSSRFRSGTATSRALQIDVSLLGRRISCLTLESLLDAITSSCLSERQIVVSSYNIHSFNLSMQLPWLYEFQQSADITINDSMGLLQAMRLLGLPLPREYRVSYTMLMPHLLETCNRHGLSLFLLGGKPSVLEAALQRVHLSYPNIPLQGHHGYFSLSDPPTNARIVEQIHRHRTRILIVSMGVPRQEQWVREQRDRLSVNTILSSGGAAIDRLAGIVADCPVWLSNSGLEWFYRMCKEPGRLSMRYLLGNPAFALHIALARSLNLRGELLRIESVNLPVA